MLAEDVIYELIKTKGKLTRAEIESELNKLKYDSPEKFKAITNCPDSLPKILEKMVANKKLKKKIVSQWKAPYYLAG